ncbi:MAG: hypothetical protein ACQETE_02590 [Bacteroidota bacterium]
MEFITEKDFDLFSKWAGKEYDKDNQEHVNVGENLNSGIASKVKYWSDEVSKQLDLVSKSSRRWTTGNGGHFKPYLWGRIYDDTKDIQDVHFSVQITSRNETALYIEIGYIREDGDLSETQKEKAENLLRRDEGGIYKKVITKDEINNYDWDRLISETVEFIENHWEVYEDVIHELQPKYFTRLCWNNNGWQEPSGPKGKSNHPSTFEGMTGLGFEEWLFSDQLKYGGYQYGFLQGVKVGSIDEPFDVDLFTIEETKEGSQAYYVATISNVERIDGIKAKEIVAASEFNAEIEESVGNVDQRGKDSINSLEFDSFINVRFKMENVIFPEGDYLLPIDLEGDTYHNYQLHEGSLFDELPSQIGRDIKTNTVTLADNGGNRPERKKNNYHRSPGAVEVTYKHAEISKKLEQHLIEINDDSASVIAERGLGSKAVDMVVDNNDEIVFYEIKTYHQLYRNIREALGQLLEYAYWPTHEDQDNIKLVVVSDCEPTGEVEGYMNRLRSEFNLPVYYQQFDMDKNILMKVI